MRMPIAVFIAVVAAAACTPRYGAIDAASYPAQGKAHWGSVQAAVDNKTAPPESAVYTCPMHPEIRRPVPGTCPKCGMSLEKHDPAEPDKKGSGGRDHISSRIS